MKDTDPSLLKYLDRIGAVPGKKIQVLKREEYDQSIDVLIEKKKVHVSQDVSKNILMTVNV